ncbi:heterokaryon incompatibility protein-domain-containing protein [Xylogone sp. PMI_703]|nr:heterokaryon incompatibility protein-domain-containing protein [Xylogone sp. PMI_703]
MSVFQKDEPSRSGCEEILRELEAISAQPRIDPNSQDILQEVENKSRRVDELFRQGRFIDARVLEDERLHALIKLYGLKDERTVESLETLVDILFQLKDNDRASKTLDVVISLRLIIQGPEHRSTLASIGSKVAQLHVLGRTSEAEHLGSNLIMICKNSLTPSDPVTLRVMSNLSSIYTSKGDYNLAETLCQAVLQVREKTLPYDHIDRVTSMVNLSGIYFGQERWLDASSLLALVLTIRRRTHGDESPLTIKVAHQMEYAYRKLGYWQNIETIQLLILNSSRKNHEEGHQSVQDAMLSLVETYIHTGAWEKATEMIKSLLRIKRLKLPPRHPEVLQLESYLKIVLDNFPNGVHPPSETSLSIYRPLNVASRNIRLVLIKKGLQESELNATLIDASLDKPPPYEALSYVWGDRRDPGSLVLNGRQMDITRNLQDALIQLRFESQDRLLWVDAIYINQEDVKERSHQVQLMRFIYTKARRTIAWLGKASRDSDLAMNLLAKLETSPTPISLMLRTLRDSSGVVVFRSLLQLFREREYWKRLWIIQEIFCSTNLILHCGELSVNYATLEKISSPFLSALDQFGTSSGMEKYGQTVYDLISAILHFSWTKDLGHAPQNEKLSDLLFSYRHCNCTNPRDRVYALIGISHLRNSNHPGLKIDYSKSVSEVYRVAVQAIIEETKELDIFYLVSEPSIDPETGIYRARQPDLPSWAPDLNCHVGFTVSLRTPFPDARASGKSQAKVRFSSDGTVLTVTGYGIASVDRSSARFERTCRRQKDVIRHLLGWRLTTQQHMGISPESDQDPRLGRFYELIHNGRAFTANDKDMWRRWLLNFSDSKLAEAYQLFL